MAKVSPYRVQPYARPRWLKAGILVCAVALSLLVSRGILRDPQVQAGMQHAAREAATFVAVERAHRKAQAAQVDAVKPPLPQPEPSVRVNALIPDRAGATPGFRKVTVGQ